MVIDEVTLSSGELMRCKTTFIALSTNGINAGGGVGWKQEGEFTKREDAVDLCRLLLIGGTIGVMISERNRYEPAV